MPSVGGKQHPPDFARGSGGRHVFYALCTLPVSAGESIILLEDTNRALRRELSDGHTILSVNPAVLPMPMPEEEDEFERGWQLGGESRLLKVEASSHLAMRTTKRWLLKGKFDRVVVKGSTRANFTACGLGAELFGRLDAQAVVPPQGKKRLSFGVRRKDWALLDAERGEKKLNEGSERRRVERRQFLSWCRDKQITVASEATPVPGTHKETPPAAMVGASFDQELASDLLGLREDAIAYRDRYAVVEEKLKREGLEAALQSLKLCPGRRMRDKGEALVRPGARTQAPRLEAVADLARLLRETREGFRGLGTRMECRGGRGVKKGAEWGADVGEVWSAFQEGLLREE